MKNFCVVLVLLAFTGVALANDDPAPAPTSATHFALPDGFAGDLVATFAFGVVGIVLLVGGFWVFDKLLTGCDFIGEVAKGNVSAGIVSAGMILGLAYIVGKIASSIIGM